MMDFLLHELTFEAAILLAILGRWVADKISESRMKSETSQLGDNAEKRYQNIIKRLGSIESKLKGWEGEL